MGYIVIIKIVFSVSFFVFTFLAYGQDADSQTSSDDLTYLREELCNLQQSVNENEAMLNLNLEADNQVGVSSRETRNLQAAVQVIKVELRQKAAEYKKAGGIRLTLEECPLHNIFLPAYEDTTELKSSLCSNIENLKTYTNDMKDVRQGLTQYGRSPTPAQKHQWARDILYLKKTIQAMKAEYKKLTAHNINENACPVIENESEE